MKSCYECGAKVHELSPRSRCVHCEYRRALVNEELNDELREQLHNAALVARRNSL
jgi:hypothetical protein